MPKIEAEPHPRGRFGPASTIKIMASEATIQTISKALGEADEGPLAQIQAVVDALGEETSLSLLTETDRIEKAGGMERGDGKGRRSPGGVFFYLARQKLPKEQRAAIFNDKMPREPKPPGWVPEKKGPKDSERSFPRRRVFEVNPSSSKFGSGGAGSSNGPGSSRFGNGPGSSRGQWSPPAVPPGTHVPPQLPNAVARGKAKLGILDALGSLHPDDQYLVLLELRVWGAGAALDVAALARLALTLSLAGFGLVVASGTLMFASQPQELLANRAFAVKIALVCLAGCNAALFHARGGLAKLDAAAKAQTLLSLGLWIGAIIAGRWIAYL